ncbi:hypothetical protein [Marinobacterium jannaschii]|uniref:hypothetical protein n=1 Tax=Marinobacterium jannaschii TaxID=64970 RepID=UPI0004803B03|nr:hypothetical protein [Marinobacterium jannaschii]
MTVPSTVSVAGPFAGNGSTTVFPFTFKILQDSDLEVVHTNAAGAETVLTLATHYTVTGAGSESGGSVAYPASGSPLPVGEKLTLRRVVQPIQETDLTNQGRYAPDVVERELDKLAMAIQQVSEEAKRSVKVKVSDDQNTPDQLRDDFFAARDQAKSSKEAAETAKQTAEAARDAALTAAYRTYKSVQQMIDAVAGQEFAFLDGIKLVWEGYYAPGDGGNNYGYLKDAGSPGGRPAENKGSIFYLPGDTSHYIEAATQKGLAILEQWGGGAGATAAQNKSAIIAIHDYAPAEGLGLQVSGLFECEAGIVFEKPIVLFGAGRASTHIIKSTVGTFFTFAAGAAFGGLRNIKLSRKAGVPDGIGAHGIVVSAGRFDSYTLQCDDFGGHGLLLQDANASIVNGFVGINNGLDGLAIEGEGAATDANAILLLNLDLRVNDRHGLSLVNCFSNTGYNVVCQGNGKRGVYINGDRNYLDGVYTEANEEGALEFGGSSNNNDVIFANKSETSGADGSGVLDNTNAGGNSWYALGSRTLGRRIFPRVDMNEARIGEPGGGSPGYLRLYDSGSVYRVALGGTDSNQVLQFLSEGPGKLSCYFEEIQVNTAVLSLLNGWANAGGSYGAAKAHKSPTGVIELSGVIGSGTTVADTNIAVLPDEYRPQVIRRISTTDDGGRVVLNVLPTGELRLASGANMNVVLDGLSFRQ